MCETSVEITAGVGQILGNTPPFPLPPTHLTLAMNVTKLWKHILYWIYSNLSPPLHFYLVQYEILYRI